MTASFQWIVPAALDIHQIRSGDDKSKFVFASREGRQGSLDFSDFQGPKNASCCSFFPSVASEITSNIRFCGA